MKSHPFNYFLFLFTSCFINYKNIFFWGGGGGGETKSADQFPFSFQDELLSLAPTILAKWILPLNFTHFTACTV